MNVIICREAINRVKTKIVVVIGTTDTPVEHTAYEPRPVEVKIPVFCTLPLNISRPTEVIAS